MSEAGSGMKLGGRHIVKPGGGAALKAGYSLLEILIVLAIIALIAALVGPRLFAQLDHAKVTTARVQVRSLETALQTMELDIGRYPTEAEGLTLLVQGDRKQVAGWNGPYLASGVPQDPWGHAYVYEPPTDASHPPKVHSLGSDGKPGGEGLAADVYNNSGT
jgi:general secretion pathway protein G